MTRADSSLALLGRSRDTGVGVAPFPVPAPELPDLRRVILRVWGYTPEDVRWAEEAGRACARSKCFEVTDVFSTLGGVSPIQPRDPLALAQGATYDRTWAAYSTTEPPTP